MPVLLPRFDRAFSWLSRAEIAERSFTTDDLPWLAHQRLGLGTERNTWGQDAERRVCALLQALTAALQLPRSCPLNGFFLHIETGPAQRHRLGQLQERWLLRSDVPDSANPAEAWLQWHAQGKMLNVLWTMGRRLLGADSMTIMILDRVLVPYAGLVMSRNPAGWHHVDPP